MKKITFYLDFISPYAYLAFERLPEALMGCTYSVEYKPVLFAAFLKKNGNLGPAEIPGKREWTYRQVAWLAQHHGIEMRMPAQHPFNPLPLLRLALACGTDGLVNRYVSETLFRHVWRGGADAGDAARLEELKHRLIPQRDPASDAVKAELKANTDEAMARGVFGVPSTVVDDKVFWGFDALTMLRECLDNGPWFEGPDWDRAARLPAGIARNPAS
ncbi:MAG TPA: 2-hydroxychromene-2-carboxylate isomerase [Ramlibacter sp.]|uniref:2-hydroxychromene-2-carboxylate isomerase n=1 Tax=Ramlibacter sp. TaxID=1917967 RepID=UPI002D079173|nr:2-hydroxychromene-2-carboxylate isomerase [Ramlibacter sp.]HVZ44015.1 2-hydroxychromene-2-carboxylate isomerase [Ramlibacter sp.]